ncbi:unnamed protein product, partial [Mesorhabditis belari]|uniref:E3 UFM1-protein ligase 1 homolog n=1 Tax=Mesorhabditis belari TaxID=2138241 RepID=A0AAF3FBF0_9BILA
MSSAWAEIQRLAADLQRVQLSEAAKKLSEANCIEVISKLIQRELIDVVFTRDGSSYITRRHLRTEVRNECLGVGGRVSLTDISAKLNVDFDHISNAASAIVAEDEEFILNNGELFAKEYVNKLQSELNVLLAEEGMRSLPSLCRQWELPAELLRSLLLDQLPKEGSEFVVDGENIYTRTFLEARTSVLRAALSAITKVTAVSNIQQKLQLPPSRFFAALDFLIKAGEVPGKIVGSRTSSTATYVPHLHEQLLAAAVKRMLTQEGHIVLSELKKMGVVDSTALIKATFVPEEINALQFLHSIVLPKETVQAQANLIEEELLQRHYTNVYSIISQSGIPFEVSDADFFVTNLKNKNKEYFVSDGFIYTKQLVTNATTSLNEKLEEQANIELNKLEQRKKMPQTANQEKDDWNEGKGGKGKKGGKAAKGRSSKRDEETNDSTNIVVEPDQLIEWLQATSVIPEELLDTISESIAETVTNKLRERVAHLAATQATTAAQSNKRSHQQTEQQLAQLHGNLCMFESGLEHFSGALQNDLCLYLLKTLGTELANFLLGYASDTPNVGQMKERQREETVNSLPSRIKDAFNSLFDSLKSEDTQKLNDNLFDVCSPSILQLNLKKLDKKMRSENCETYKAHLFTQLNEQTDPAAALLSAVLYLYAKEGVAVHASGKFVSQLVPKLATLIDTEIYDLLGETQKLVVSSLKNKDDAEIKNQLDESLNTLRSRLGA